MRVPVIGVMGGHDVESEVEQDARRLGRAIAEAGWAVLTGGRDEGIMLAATAAAKAAGGHTIGIHPGVPGDAAAPADFVIYTGMGFARNAINVLSSDVVVALPGAHGTLSEVAYAHTYGKPTVFFGFEDRGFYPDVPRATTVAECIALIEAALA